ncbi:hypothetical protein GCM10020216_092770 [Nonomuraea helvata]
MQGGLSWTEPTPATAWVSVSFGRPHRPDPIVGTLHQRVPTNCLALYPAECKREPTPRVFLPWWGGADPLNMRGSAVAWTEERRERSDRSDEGRQRLKATKRASAEQRP